MRIHATFGARGYAVVAVAIAIAFAVAIALTSPTTGPHEHAFDLVAEISRTGCARPAYL